MRFEGGWVFWTCLQTWFKIQNVFICIMHSLQHVEDVPLGLCVCLGYLFYDNCKIWSSHEAIFRATKTLEFFYSGKKCPNLFQHFQCPGNGIDIGSRQFVGNLNWHIDLSA